MDVALGPSLFCNITLCCDCLLVSLYESSVLRCTKSSRASVHVRPEGLGSESSTGHDEVICPFLQHNIRLLSTTGVSCEAGVYAV